MTITGSGVGGNIGGPIQPTPRDIETTAWTMVNKAALGILPDTLEVPFSQLGGNVWKYQSDSNRPILKPLGNIRTTTPEEPTIDESWKSNLDELINQLHPELRARLKDEMGKLFENRNPNYSIFDNVLTMTAKGMSWLDRAQQQPAPDSPTGERTEQNQGLIGKAIHGAVHHSRSQLNAAENYLKFTGANLPYHDDLLYFLEEGKGIQEDLNTFLEMLQDPNSPPPSKEELTSLAKDATTLANQFNRASRSNDLQMLGPMFEAMAAVASALSLTPTTPTLFLGLKMASRGLFSSDSQGGLIGGDMEALIKSLTSGMLSSLMKNAGIAKQMMLIMTLLGTISGATTLAGLVAEFGIGRFPSESEEDAEEGQQFTLELILELLASTGLLKTVHEIAAQASGAPENAQAMISDIMELVSLLLMAFAGGKGDPDKTTKLLKSLNEHLDGKLEKIEKFVLSNDSTEAKVVDVALKQGLVALKNENFEGLFVACQILLDQLGCSSEFLAKDLQEINEFGRLLNQASSSENQEQARSITSMIRAA